jgi:hypothetical protein
MKLKLFNWFYKRVEIKEVEPPRRVVEIKAIRSRLEKQGWTLRELQIRRQTTVAAWRVVAFKGAQSIEATEKTLDEAVRVVGKMLGVIALDKKV